MWFKIIWTAFWIFVISMISQEDSSETLKEKIYRALAITILFTPITMGYIILFTGEDF